MKRGFTLIEMFVSMAIFSAMLLTVLLVVSSIAKRVSGDTDEARLRVEINYALDNIKLYTISAAKVAADSTFSPPPAGGQAEKSEFGFQGEKNVYNITPAVITDNTDYRYYRNDAGDIVLMSAAVGTEEVLVSSRFSPQITFTYKSGFEPNFLEVTISGTAGKLNPQRISKTAGLRLWFAGVVQ